MSLAPTRQGILAYKSCYLYPSRVLSPPVPFINAGVGSPRQKCLIKTGNLAANQPDTLPALQLCNLQDLDVEKVKTKDIFYNYFENIGKLPSLVHQQLVSASALTGDTVCCKYMW